MVQYETPHWDPLMEVVGPRVIGDFMWMHEVKLTDGRAAHAYKHIDTRRYIHLDEEGNAFVYTDSGRWRSRRDRLVSRLRLSHYGLTISAAAVSGSMFAASAMPARYSSVLVSAAVRFRS
jgi:hypothetical protein